MKTKQTQIEFKKLGELCLNKGEYGSGASAVNYDKTKPRYVRITDIDENGNLKGNNKVSPSIVEEKYFLKEGDLLFARSGSVGKSFLYKKEYGKCQYAGYLIRFEVNKKIMLPEYLFLLTKTPYYLAWIKQISESKTVTMSNINAKEYSDFEVPIFSIEIQKKIIKLLSNVESLKKLRKQSDKLTQNYLKSVFAEMFLKKKGEFEEVELKDVCDIIMGQSPPGKSYNGKGNGMPFFQGKAEFGIRYPKIKKWTTKPSKIAEAGSILMSVRAPVGSVNMCNVKCCIGRGLASIKPTEKSELGYVYFLLQTIEKKIADLGSGSTFKAINSNQLRNLRISLPPIALQKKFAKIVEQVEKLKEYQQQSNQEIINLFGALMQRAFKGELV